MSEKDVSNGISLVKNRRILGIQYHLVNNTTYRQTKGVKRLEPFKAVHINFYLLVLVICIFLFSLVPGHRTCEKTYTHTQSRKTPNIHVKEKKTIDDSRLSFEYR